MKKVILYKKIANHLVQCLACSWYCKIADKQLGVCATRYNKNGCLYSLVYGKAVGLHLDPVEKKPLYHFLPGSNILSFGTVGCNFGCLFCQNWQMSQINKIRAQNSSRITRDRTQNSEEELIELINQTSQTITPKEIVAAALDQKAHGIAYTYNEPAIFIEFAYDTAKLAKKKGLKNIFVSNGFESDETFNLIKEFLDGINIDLKSFSQEFYQKICKAKIDPVLKNIEKFFRSGIETEITTLIIPGHNDSADELNKIAEFLANISKDIPWHISAFYPAYKMIDVPSTSHKTLINVYKIGKKVGLKYVYVGNVLDVERSSTYCPKCGQLLIFRDGYYVKIKNLDPKKGVCKNCAEKIYGLWK